MEALPWYKSPVFISLLVSVIMQLVALGEPLGLKLQWTEDQVTHTVGAVAQLVAVLAAAFAGWKRYRSNLQPLAATKASAEAKTQAGFARPAFLVMLAAASSLALVGAGCTGTRAAYKAAESPDQVAYVVAEHYSAVVVQAALIARKPGTPAAVIEGLQRADQRAKPAVEALLPLRNAYLAAKTAGNQAALQAAIDKAVLAVSDLIKAVKSAGGTP